MVSSRKVIADLCSTFSLFPGKKGGRGEGRFAICEHHLDKDLHLVCSQSIIVGVNGS